MKPDISVIVPVYNSEKYLRQCIESILCQKKKEIELVLVNDGSTDNSENICHSYQKQDNRVKIIKQRNRGLIATRAKGIEASSADYVLFVDSDDWIDDTLIEKLYTPVLDNPEIDVVISGYVLNKDGYDKKPFCATREGFYDKREVLRELFERRHYDVSGCAKLYKKDILPDLGTPWTTNSFGEDTEMNWKVFSKGALYYYIPVYEYHYRMHGDSMTHGKIGEEWDGYLERYGMILRDPLCKDGVQDAIMTEILRAVTPIFINEIRYKTYTDNKKSRAQALLQKAYVALDHKCDDRDISDVMNLIFFMPDTIKHIVEDRIHEFVDGIKQHVKDEIYIWGCGEYARRVCLLLNSKDMDFKGFVQSKKTKCDFMGHCVYEYDAILKENPQAFFILALNGTNTDEVTACINEETRYVTLDGVRLYI